MDDAVHSSRARSHSEEQERAETGDDLPAGYTRAAQIDDELSRVIHEIAGRRVSDAERDRAWRLIEQRAALMVSMPPKSG